MKKSNLRVSIMGTMLPFGQRKSVFFLFFLILFGVSNISNAATYFTRASTAWNVNTTWSTVGFGGAAVGAGIFPIAGDIVNIGNGYTVTISAAAACATLNINDGGTLTVNSTLTVSGITTVGTVTATARLNNNGTTTATGNLLGTGALVQGASSTLNINGTSAITTLTASAAGNTVNYTAAAQTVKVTPYQNLTLSGSGTKTIGALTVNGILSMEGTATASAAITYGASATLRYNTTTNRTASVNEWPATFIATGGVIISNTGQITTPGALQMGNNTNVPLNIQSGASLLASGLITLHGNFVRVGTFTSAFGITIGGTTATQSIDGFTTSSSVILSKPSGVATFQGNVNGATLTLNSATPFTGTLNLGAALTHTFTGTLTGTAGTLNGGSSTLKIGGNISGSGGTFTAGTSTVEWNATGNQTIASGAAITYYNLILSGSGNKTFIGATTISANLTISGTAVANLGTFIHSANSLTLGGIGQVGDSHGSTGSTATTKNDTYFLSSTGRVNVTTCTAPATGAVITYYSRNATSGGNWNDNTSWTTISDGTGGPLASGVWPRIYDNVVIRSGHTITVDAITDNNYCGISPDGLANANIGAGGGTGFNGSNGVMFYQTGDITISGTLTVISGVNVMVAGYTHIASTGTFSLTSYLVNAGYLEADASSTLTTLDDLSLTGNSTTIINTNATSADDLNIDHTLATLCGTGTSGLLNSGGSAINYTNSATVAQICTSFTVTCSGGGCAGFPVVGTTSVILGNTGPGGIDKSDGTGSLEFWLDSYDVNGNGTNPANGATIVTWRDKSGNNVNVTRNVTNAATYSTAPGVTFAGNGYLLGSDATFPSGGSARTAYVCASTPNTANDNVLLFYGNDAASQAYGIMKSATETVRNFFYGNDLDDAGGWLPAGQTKVVNTRYAASFQEIFVDGTSTATKTATPNTSVGLDGVQIGGWSAYPITNSFATIKEVILHSKAINNAQRIIIDNYLAAKYNSTLASNDIYTMDNVGFDYQMAAIGQASDGSNHKDAKGPGIVRMWNPNALANSEFLLWGHDNTTLVSSTTTVGLAGVDGTVIKERLVRIWGVSEQGGDVGTVSVSFDISLFPSSMGSDLRLLIDRDGDGFGDNDVTPVAGSSSGNIIVFSGVNFQNGDRFTLGNTDLSTPLPIGLLNFNATAKSEKVVLDWSTAMELNNDYFTIERASDIEHFEEVTIVKGKGTSSAKINYRFIDETPLSGISYYRLKQTDFDGKFTYSELRNVEVTGIPTYFKVYPNPAVDHKFNFELIGVDPDSEVPVKILNSLGVSVFESTFRADQNGRIKATVDLSPVSSGVYIVNINAATGLRERILIR